MGRNLYWPYGVFERLRNTSVSSVDMDDFNKAMQLVTIASINRYLCFRITEHTLGQIQQTLSLTRKKLKELMLASLTSEQNSILFFFGQILFRAHWVLYVS